DEVVSHVPIFIDASIHQLDPYFCAIPDDQVGDLDENIEQGQRPRELGKPHFVENANQIPLAVVHSTVAEQHGKRRCAHVRFSKALGKYFMASTRGLWATMPKPQMLPSSISQPTSLARFSAPGSPVS